MTKRLSFALAPLGSVLAISLASTAFAQGTPETAADTSGQLGEIIVTAQRRAEPLQKVPISVAVISGQSLEKRGLSDVYSLSSAVPNLVVAKVGNALQYYIRGVGFASTTIPTDEPSVAVYVDGVYISSTGVAAALSLNSIERVEVLRGPQGTLFGRNTTGGSIQIKTRDPQQEPEARIEAGYGNYDTWTAKAYLTGGLSDTVAANLAFAFEDQNHGFGKNLVTGADVFTRRNYSARSKLMFTPSDETKILIEGDYSRLHSADPAYQIVQGVVARDGTTYPGPFDTRASIPIFNRQRNYGGSATITQELGSDITFTSISAYRNYRFKISQDIDGAPIFGGESILSGKAHNFSQELQLASNNNAGFNWITGVFYYKLKGGFSPALIPAPVIPGGRQYFSRQMTRSASIFGQATLDIVQGTRLTLGVRYTDEKKTAIARIVQAGVVTVPDTPSAQGAKPLTWRIALDHEFSDYVRGYISYNRGFKGGGFDFTSPGSKGYKPERLDAFEAGIKSELFDRHVRLNVAGFYYRPKDIQLKSAQSAPGGGTVSLTLNAAEAEIYGVDIDTQIQLSRNFALSGGIGLLHGRYTNAPNLVTNTATGAAVIINATGNDTVLTPKITANMNADYTLPTAIGNFNFNASLTYNDGSYASVANRLRFPAYTTINYSAGWQSNDERWGATFWIRNLTDEIYYATRMEQGSRDTQIQAPPRTYGITFKAKI